jgi:hypothetical protein
MAIIDQISKTKLGLGGKEPVRSTESLSSTLHFKYSSEGTPTLKGYPAPSKLGTKFRSGNPPSIYSQIPPK